MKNKIDARIPEDTACRTKTEFTENTTGSLQQREAGHHASLRQMDQQTPVKQAHRICEKTLVVIAEDLVRRFGIDENTWFEQIPDENGIFLRIIRS
jgi:hypothetical protein